MCILEGDEQAEEQLRPHLPRSDVAWARSLNLLSPVPHGRSRVDKKFRAILRGGRGGRPISLYVSQKVLFSLNTFNLVELLNSLLGALRAFRSPIPLNVPGPLPSRRTVGERSFPSIPSFPWLAEDKLIPVVLERCYVPFTSAKVVPFLGLFSPFHQCRFLNLFAWAYAERF